MARGLLGIIVAVAVFFTNACCAFGMESQPLPVQAASSSCCHHATKAPAVPQAPDHSSSSQRACCQKITPGHDDGGKVVDVSPFLTITWLTPTPPVDAAL